MFRFSKSKEICRFPKPGRYSIEISEGKNLSFEVLEQSAYPDGYNPALKNMACAIIEQLTLALSYTRVGQTVTPQFDCSKCGKIKKIRFTNPGV